MMYKNILLTVLLVPFVIASNSDIDARIQELKNARDEKSLELSNISKTIAEKESLIEAIESKGRIIYSKISDKLNEQEAKEFKNELNTFEDNLGQALAKKNDIQPLLMKVFINGHKDTEDELESIKSLVIRHRVEYILLKKLFKHYEKCLQELIKIDHELDNLQKQTLNN